LPKPNQINAALKYAGMAFQMGFILAIGAFLGLKIDRYFATKRPYFTALFVLIFLFIAFYLTLKDLLFGKKD
jgi:F0F1-type ATP synthase assembly protein I